MVREAILPSFHLGWKLEQWGRDRAGVRPSAREKRQTPVCSEGLCWQSQERVRDDTAKSRDHAYEGVTVTTYCTEIFLKTAPPNAFHLPVLPYPIKSLTSSEQGGTICRPLPLGSRNQGEPGESLSALCLQPKVLWS